MLAFHGFGQRSESMSSIINALSYKYTIYAFDLFFHGESTWSDVEKPLYPEDWRGFLKSILEKHKIDTFSIIAFSIGAKFALSTLTLFPGRIQKIFLIAPDGIGINFWYSLATRFSLTRSYFKSIVRKPNRLSNLLYMLKAMRIIDRSLFRFASHYMSTEERRQQVYHVWTVFRHLNVSKADITLHLNDNNVMLSIFLGAYDKVIVKRNITSLLKRIRLHHLEIICCKHGQLLEKATELLVHS
ncbi:alpha/beta hydrolase [Fulvivirga sp. M361]|uniref:alpha/beta hydrolase n=1 Tax=Fulvivirga sp. M361 TaxID=2594266 RepID=UPI002104DD17|nr:alpha/beta hydrolase [Fulvivirga sp. M361]